MKKVFLGLLVFVPVINGAELEQEVAEGITTEQVGRIEECVLNSTLAYDVVAADFFDKYNYNLFIGLESPLKELCKKVHGVLEIKQKKWRGKKTESYRRLQLLHAFLAVVQQKDPFQGYGIELKEEKNGSLKDFHNTALDSTKKIGSLTGCQWATNATLFIVAYDVQQRRKRFDQLNDHGIYEN